MHQFQRMLTATIFIFSLASCKEGELALLGRGVGERIVESRISAEEYEPKITQIILSVQDSMIPLLNEQSQQDKKWELQLVALGVGLEASIGFGPFRAGISPGVRVFFTNTENPPPLP